MKTLQLLSSLMVSGIALTMLTQCTPAPCTKPLLPEELRDYFDVNRKPPCTDRFGNAIEADNLIIHFPAGVGRDYINDLRQQYKPDDIDSCLCDPRLQNWKWNDPAQINIEETVSQMTQQSKREGSGVDASLNYLVYAFDPVVRGDPHGTSTLGSRKPYETPNGKIIAVLDTGLDTTFANAKLLTLYADSSGTGCAPRGSQGWNFILENTDISDNSGHGTAVTGVIAETLSQASQGGGYTCGARFLILKVLNDQGYGNLFDAMCAIQYAIHVDAEVINISWGFYNVDAMFSELNPFLRDSILSLITPSGRHPVFVTSRGNEGRRNIGNYRHYPSDYDVDLPFLIAVAGDTRSGIWQSPTARAEELWLSSNYELNVEMLTAPAYEVIVWSPSAGNFLLSRLAFGTSYSAAFVTAEAAITQCCNTDAGSNNVNTHFTTVGPKGTMMPSGDRVKYSNVALNLQHLCID